jgi:Flp pilus assembly protein TadB
VSAAVLAVMPLLAAVFILICGNGIISTLVPLRAGEPLQWRMLPAA